VPSGYFANWQLAWFAGTADERPALVITPECAVGLGEMYPPSMGFLAIAGLNAISLDLTAGGRPMPGR
jgi:hypothetical protein